MKKSLLRDLENISEVFDNDDTAESLREIAAVCQEEFDSWSDRRQESERGEAMQEFIDHLEAAADAFDDMRSELSEALEMDI